MSKATKDMSREELEAEVLRLLDKMRDEALRHVREIEEYRAAFERKPPESEKGFIRLKRTCMSVEREFDKKEDIEKGMGR